jgi:hypothetical protein
MSFYAIINDKSYLHSTLKCHAHQSKEEDKFDHRKLNFLCWKTISATRDKSNVGKTNN